jgi:hypothetical protein
MRLLSAATLVPLAVAAVACGDSGRPAARTAAATAGSTILNCDTAAAGAVVGVAVTEFIKRAQPTPQRYLSAVGPGTTPMPETGFRALKDRGPTYLYPATDTAGQAKVKAQLADVGPYTSLLVTFGGARVTADGNEATVRVGGRYVGGDHDGRVAPVRAVRLRCEGATWAVVDAEEERST